MPVSRSTRRGISLHEVLGYLVFLVGLVYGAWVVYTVMSPW